jgi:hypothetical protein
MSWLTSRQLVNLVKKNGTRETLKAFIGVYPIDKLPKRLPHVPALLIINSDSNNLPGTHWKAVYISAERKGEVFDSLTTPVSIHLARWLNTFTNARWKRTPRIIQHPLSAICGVYVLYFILNRLKVKSAKSIMKQFGSSTFANDKAMLDFFSSMRK